MLSARELAAFAFALLLTVLGVAFMLASGAITALSAETPIPDPVLDYAWGVTYAMGLGATVAFLPLQPRERIAVATIWIVKVAVTLIAMPFYEAFYIVLDAFTYYQVAASPTYVRDSLEVGQGTENVYGLIWLLYWLMPVSYHAVKVVFAYVGLLGVVLFYRAAVAFAGRDDLRVLYLLALFPSVLFWSSILGKEPLALAAIGLYAFGVVRWYRAPDWPAALCIVAGVVAAMFVRAWLAPILIAPLAILGLLTARQIHVRLAALGVMVMGLAASLGQLAEMFAVETTQDLLAAIDSTSQLWAQGGSGRLLEFDLLQPLELAAAFPVAAFTALFRPLPGEVPHLFGTIAGFENLALLALVAVAIVRGRLADLRQPLVAWALTVIVGWTILYAFVSYQNLGAAVRFRLQVLPLLLGVLMFLARPRSARGPDQDMDQSGAQLQAP